MRNVKGFLAAFALLTFSAANAQNSVVEKVDSVITQVVEKEKKPLSAADAVTASISYLPEWKQFTAKDIDALKKVNGAYNALKKEEKSEVSASAVEKLTTINKKVASTTIPALAKYLQINKSFSFDLASSDGRFSAEQLERLRFIAECLKMNPNVKVNVIGHTCNIGSEEMNEVYGFDRAIHVKNYLVRFGADEDQIIMDTKTSKCPVAPNTTEANRAKNRRTEITLAQPSSKK